MTVGSDTLTFTYDASGRPLSVSLNGTTYYYVTNLQGDVTAILNTFGTAVVTYTYDAWGNPLATSGDLATTLGTLNPLRYRGYVYDTETGIYYVSSRYYDLSTSRFLNADILISTGQGMLGNNMFAYCRNNPISRRDISGFADETDLDCTPNLDEDKLDGKASTGSGTQVTVGSVGNSGNGGYTYSAPSGGGGVSTSVQVGNTTVTFGHGGRHIGGTDISEIENFIASDVVNRPITAGQAEGVSVSFQGRALYYSYFTRSGSLINVGTYYFEKIAFGGE